MTKHLILLAAAQALFLNHAAAAVYKWVDEQGVTHYSQTPPSTGQAQILPPPPPPAEDPDAANRRLGELQERLKKLEEARAKAREETRKKAEEEAARKENCRRARERLAALEPTPRVLMRKPDGRVVRLSDEARLKELDKAREAIKKYCM